MEEKQKKKDNDTEEVKDENELDSLKNELLRMSSQLKNNEK
jgi:hypothetical protein